MDNNPFAYLPRKPAPRPADPRAEARNAFRTEAAQQKAQSAPANQKVKFFTDPSGRVIPITAPSGAAHMVRRHGFGKMLFDPGTNEPYQAAPGVDGKMVSAWDSVTPRSRDGRLEKYLPGVGIKDLGEDPKAVAKREAANTKEAEKQKKAEDKQSAADFKATQGQITAQINTQKAAINYADTAYADDYAGAYKRLTMAKDDLASDKRALSSLESSKKLAKFDEMPGIKAKQIELQKQIDAKTQVVEEREIETTRSALRKEEWLKIKAQADQAIKVSEIQVKSMTNTGRLPSQEAQPPAVVPPADAVEAPTPEQQAKAYADSILDDVRLNGSGMKWDVPKIDIASAFTGRDVTNRMDANQGGTLTEQRADWNKTKAYNANQEARAFETAAGMGSLAPVEKLRTDGAFAPDVLTRLKALSEVGKGKMFVVPGKPALAFAGDELKDNGQTVGKIVRDELRAPRLYIEHGKHGQNVSPSLLSGHAYDGVPEYSAPTPQFIERAGTEADVAKAWAGQHWTPGITAGLLKEWESSNDAERADIVARVQPWQAGVKAEDRRLNFRELYKSGQVSLQEARHMERMFYGVQPGIQDSRESWEAFKAGDAPQAKAVRELTQQAGSSINGELIRQKVAAQQSAITAWASDFYKRNSTRADFDPNAFTAYRDELLGKEAGLNRVASSLAETLQNVPASSFGIAVGLANLGLGLAADTWQKGIKDATGASVDVRGFTKDYLPIERLTGGAVRPANAQEQELIRAQTEQSTLGLFDFLAQRATAQGGLEALIALPTLGTSLVMNRKDSVLWNGASGKSLRKEADKLFEAIDSDTLTDSQFAELATKIQAAGMASRGWDMNDPATEPERYDMSNPGSPLAQYVAAYTETRDPAYKEMFLEAAVTSRNGQAIQAQVAEYAASKGHIQGTWLGNVMAFADSALGGRVGYNREGSFSPMQQGYAGALVAPLQEMGVEVLSNLAGVGVGKLVTTGAKSAGKAMQAGRALSFVQRVARDATELEQALVKLGTKSPVNKVLMQVGASAAGEGTEEAVSATMQPGATLGDVMSQAATGALGGVSMAAPQAAAGALIGIQQQQAQAKAKNEANTRFVEAWNTAFPSNPLTVDGWTQAQHYMDSAGDQQRLAAIRAKTMELAKAERALSAGPPTPEVASALKAVRDDINSLFVQQSQAVGEAVQAMQEVQGIQDPALRAFAHGTLKAMRGAPLTETERVAVENAVNEQGLVMARPGPAGYIVTDAGLAALGEVVPWTRSTFYPADETAQIATPAPQPFVQSVAAPGATLPQATPATEQPGIMAPAQPGEPLADSSGVVSPPAPTGEVESGQASPSGFRTVSVTLTGKDGKSQVLELQIAAASQEEAEAKAMQSPVVVARQRNGATAVITPTNPNLPDSAPLTAPDPVAQTTTNPEREARLERQRLAAEAGNGSLLETIKNVGIMFGHVIVDTGIPSGMSDRYGTALNLGTAMFDKLKPGNDIGQWIDAYSAKVNPEWYTYLREHGVEPGLHRVWFGHDPLANLATVLEKFPNPPLDQLFGGAVGGLAGAILGRKLGKVGRAATTAAGAVAGGMLGTTGLSYAGQLAKDGLTKSGIPLPGVQWLVQSGVVSAQNATKWLSMNVGEALSGGLAILGTYRLWKKAKNGQHISNGWAIFGIASKIVGGVLQANPVLILSAAADSAILMVPFTKEAIRKAFAKKQALEASSRTSEQTTLAPVVAPTSKQTPVESTVQPVPKVDTKPDKPSVDYTALARRVIDSQLKNSPSLRKRVKIVDTVPAGLEKTSGMVASESGVLVSMPVLVDQLDGMTASQAGQHIAKVLDEELRHVAHLKASRDLHAQIAPEQDYGVWLNAYYGQMWKDFTDAQRKAIREAYGDTMDEMPADWMRAFEGLRIISQLRAKGDQSETTRLWTNLAKEALAHLKAVFDYLKSLAKSELTPAMERDLAAIQAILAENGYGKPVVVNKPAVVEQQTKLSADVGARKATPEGLARLEAAKQRLRDIINNPDIVGKQRVDMIANGKELIAFLQTHADTRKPFDSGFEHGNAVAYTHEDAPEGFRSFIFLEGNRAGETGVAKTPDTRAADVAKAQSDFQEQQAGAKRLRESGKSDQNPASPKNPGVDDLLDKQIKDAEIIELTADLRKDGLKLQAAVERLADIPKEAAMLRLQGMVLVPKYQRLYDAADDLRLKIANAGVAPIDVQYTLHMERRAKLKAESTPSPKKTEKPLQTSTGSNARTGAEMPVPPTKAGKAPSKSGASNALKAKLRAGLADLIDAPADAGEVVYDASQEQENESLPSAYVSKRTTAPITHTLPDGYALTGKGLHSAPVRAYHGTPHKIPAREGFRLDKIGTGEGAQAFGYGLYFSESRAVGEEYRKNLTMKWVTTQEDDGTWTAYESGNKSNSVKSLSKLDAIELAKQKSEGGNLYTVELLPDEEDFLDWDKPLSEQSEKVSKAIQDLAVYDNAKRYGLEKVFGSNFYNNYAKAVGGHNKASEYLASFGIPGIRYADGQSRVSPLEIRARQREVAARQADVERDPSLTNKSQLSYAESALADLMKKDREGTRNYVIFDESLVRILEENGKPVDTLPSAPVKPSQMFLGSVQAQDARDNLASELRAKKDQLTSQEHPNAIKQSQHQLESLAKQAERGTLNTALHLTRATPAIYFPDYNLHRHSYDRSADEVLKLGREALASKAGKTYLAIHERDTNTLSHWQHASRARQYVRDVSGGRDASRSIAFLSAEQAKVQRAYNRIEREKAGISEEKVSHLLEGGFRDSLASAPLKQTITQRGVPAEKIGTLVQLADAALKEGIDTPEKLAALLDETFDGGGARALSQALWDAMGMVRPELRGTHDWAAIYSPPSTEGNRSTAVIAEAAAKLNGEQQGDKQPTVFPPVAQTEETKDEDRVNVAQTFPLPPWFTEDIESGLGDLGEPVRGYSLTASLRRRPTFEGQRITVDPNSIAQERVDAAAQIITESINADMRRAKWFKDYTPEDQAKRLHEVADHKGWARQWLAAIDSRDAATLLSYNNSMNKGSWKVFQKETGIKFAADTDKARREAIVQFVGAEAVQQLEADREAARIKRETENAAKVESSRLPNARNRAAAVSMAGYPGNGAEWVEAQIADGWTVQNVSTGPVPLYRFKKGSQFYKVPRKQGDNWRALFEYGRLLQETADKFSLASKPTAADTTTDDSDADSLQSQLLQASRPGGEKLGPDQGDSSSPGERSADSGEDTTGSGPATGVGQLDGERGESDGGKVPGESPGTKGGAKGSADDADSERGGSGASVDTPALRPGRENYHLTDPEAIVGGGAKTRFRKNKAALETLETIQSEDRDPTDAELDILAAYTGWGALAQEVFRGSFEQHMGPAEWAEDAAWLRQRLGKEDWTSAQDSILNAHYTDPPTFDAIWEMARRMGFNGGRVLEPSEGIGNGWATMPRDLMAASQMTGIEMDPTTSAIAKMLHPRANHRTMPYQDSKTSDNFYDLVYGNWPFSANDKPADPRFEHLKATVHNFFFVKALAQTRPGGLVIGITSAGTMDAKGSMIRKYLAARSELVASYRLPTGAFGKYAGTKVVVDLIILKKREKVLDRDAAGEGWIESKKHPTHDFSINEYYLANPQNILGRLDFGHGTTSGRPGMIVHRPDNYEQLLRELPLRLPENIMTPWTGVDRERIVHNTSGERRQGTVVFHDNDLYQVDGESLKPLEDEVKWMTKTPATEKKRRAEGKALIELRRAFTAMLDAQRQQQEGETERKALLELYKAYAATHGPLTNSVMLKNFRKAGDQYALDLYALVEMENGKEVPRAIMLRSIVRRTKLDSTGSIADAYALHRSESLHFDAEAVAKLAGGTTTAQEVIDFLTSKSLLYRQPDGRLTPGEIYLAGNVRQKLREAIAAKEEGVQGMDRSIEALEAVQPADLAYHDITVQMGAGWVPVSDYERFIAETLGSEDADDVQVVKASTGYNVRVSGRTVDKDDARTTWNIVDDAGNSRLHPSRIFQAAMNNTELFINDTVSDGNGGTQLVPNKVLTERAIDLRDRVRAQFGLWLWQDEGRISRLTMDYNEALNSIVNPKFDGSHLRLPGLALAIGKSGDEFTFRQHQLNAVWRGILNRQGVYAHEVGTGKTFTMAGLAIEGKRLGAHRKSLLFAHNANAAAVAADFRLAYPGARVLFIDNLSPANRDRTLRQIATDEWDAVIVPHSLVSRFGLKAATMWQMVQPEIDRLEAEFWDEVSELDGINPSTIDLDDPRSLNGTLNRVKNSATAKELASARRRIMSRVAAQIAKFDKPGTVFFEDMGVDSIIVDEAHEFKKISIATRKNVKGLQKSESGRGFNLGLLTDYVQMNNDGKGVHLFTGTPVTNTLNEVFNMMRYTMNSLMGESGINNFDDWYNQFATSYSETEPTSGGTYEEVMRLRGFINVPELARMAGRVFDVVRADDMPEFVPRKQKDGMMENPVGRPHKQIRPIVIQPTPVAKRVRNWIRQRFFFYRGLSSRDRMTMQKERGDVPMLMDGDGRVAALDPRLVTPTAEDDPNSKVNFCVRSIMEHYKEDEKTTQMVFVERGAGDYTDAEVPIIPRQYDNDGKPVTYSERRKQFNLLRDMVQKLVDQGVNPSEIAVFADLKLMPLPDGQEDILLKVHRVRNSEQKEATANLMKQGKIRIAFGGTQTMGTGVNAQTYLRAMHHLDVPFMPGELEQRNGRGWRQGNKWNTVYEYRYTVEGSADGKSWGILTNKIKFIERFIMMLQGRGLTRVLEGEGADAAEEEDGASIAEFEQMFSTAAGDPRLILRSSLQKKVDRLQQTRNMHLQFVEQTRRKIEKVETLELPNLRKQLKELEAASALYKEVAGKPFEATLYQRIEGKRTAVKFTDRESFDEAMKRLPRFTAKELIGHFGPFDIHVVTTLSHDYYQLTAGESEINFNSPSAASMEGTLRWMEPRAAKFREDIEAKSKSLDRSKTEMQKPFGREAELALAVNSLAKIAREIKLSPTPAPGWLRFGAPQGSLIYLKEAGNLVAYDLQAHRWDDSGYWAMLEQGDELVPFRYSELLDSSGARIFEDHAHTKPPTVSVVDDTAAAPQAFPGVESALHHEFATRIVIEADGTEVATPRFRTLYQIVRDGFYDPASAAPVRTPRNDSTRLLDVDTAPRGLWRKREKLREILTKLESQKETALRAVRIANVTKALKRVEDRKQEAAAPTRLPSVPSISAPNTLAPAEFMHTRDRVPVFVAKMTTRLSDEQFKATRSKASAAGGHYSNFKGAGAIPGFHFKTADARDAFIASNGTASTDNTSLASAPIRFPSAQAVNYPSKNLGPYKPNYSLPLAQAYEKLRAFRESTVAKPEKGSNAINRSVEPKDIKTIPEDLERARADAAKGGPDWAAKVDLSQPVGVWIDNDGTLNMFDGHHRWLAATMTGRKLAVRDNVFSTALRSAPIRITPKQDAAYMAAVEAGDMATAQRLVDAAAKDAGGAKVWHGGNIEGNVIDTDRRERGAVSERRPGTFFGSTSKEAAKTYPGKTNAMFFFLKNPFRISTPAMRPASWTGETAVRTGKGVANRKSSLSIGEAIDRAKANGYDGVVYENIIDVGRNFAALTPPIASTVIAFSPNQIKSADPITRDESGNVIPLSQRFNEDSNSILYSAPIRINAAYDRLSSAPNRLGRSLRDMMGQPSATTANPRETLRTWGRLPEPEFMATARANPGQAVAAAAELGMKLDDSLPPAKLKALFVAAQRFLRTTAIDAPTGLPVVNRDRAPVRPGSAGPVGTFQARPLIADPQAHAQYKAFGAMPEAQFLAAAQSTSPALLARVGKMINMSWADKPSRSQLLKLHQFAQRLIKNASTEGVAQDVAVVGGKQQAPVLSNDLLDRAKSASEGLESSLRESLDKLFSTAKSMLLSDTPHWDHVRKTDYVTVPQALELIAKGGNAPLIAGQWRQHRNDALERKTDAPTPFTEFAAGAVKDSLTPAPAQRALAAYDSLNRDGMVAVPDLAREAGMSADEIKAVLQAMNERGEIYLTPSDEPRNLTPEQKAFQVPNGMSPPGYFVTRMSLASAPLKFTNSLSAQLAQASNVMGSDTREALPMDEAIVQIESFHGDPEDTDYWPNDMAEQWAADPLRRAVEEEGDFLQALPYLPDSLRNSSIIQQYAAASERYNALDKWVSVELERINALPKADFWALAGPSAQATYNEISSDDLTAFKRAVFINELKDRLAKETALSESERYDFEAANELSDEAGEFLESEEMEAVLQGRKNALIDKVKIRVNQAIAQIEATGRYTWDANTGTFDEQDAPEVLYAAPVRQPGQGGNVTPAQISAQAQKQGQQIAARNIAAKPSAIQQLRAGAQNWQTKIGNAYYEYLAGNIDRLERYAPGITDLLADYATKEGLARSAVNGVMQQLLDRAKAGFGYPAWWKGPKVVKAWNNFKNDLLPIAAHLEAQGVKADGSFDWKPFDMRIGSTELSNLPPGTSPGDTIPWHGGTGVVGTVFDVDTPGAFNPPSTRKVLILRPMSESAQQKVYDDFVKRWQGFPVAKELLDEFIMPGQEKSRFVGAHGVRTATFNRYSLRDLFNEWSPELVALLNGRPLPDVPGIEGYTPDVFHARTLSAYLQQGLMKSFKSGARKMKTGGARESGNVLDLFAGFNTRLMEAHLEKVRVERRAKMIEVAAQPSAVVPQDGSWTPIDKAFERIYEAAVTVRGLDRADYPTLTQSLNPSQQKLMRLLFGDAMKLRGQNKSIPTAIEGEMLGELAMQHSEHFVTNLIEGLLNRFNANSLASPVYVANNWLGNEILKAMFTLKNALVAGFALSSGNVRGARLHFSIMRNMLTGMVADRMPIMFPRGIRDIAPRELFDNSAMLNQLNGLQPTVLDNLKAFNPGGAILTAMRADRGDTAAKVQLANASYKAYMVQAWRDAVAKDPTLATRIKDRKAWMKGWLAGKDSQKVHRDVRAAAELWLMNYANTPRWMSADNVRNPAGRIIIKSLIPFARWQYSFLHLLKHLALDDGLNKVRTKGQRAEGLGNLLTLASGLWLPAQAMGLYRQAPITGAIATAVAAKTAGAIGAALAGDDDDKRNELEAELDNELIGRINDLEGGKLPLQLQARNRFNASALARRFWTAAGLDGYSEQDFSILDKAGRDSDLWLRYRNMPMIKESIVLGLGMSGQSEAFGDAWKGYFEEAISFGMLADIYENTLGDGKFGIAPSVALTRTATDLATAPLVPHRLRSDVARMMDLTDRKFSPSKNLNYNPGPFEALQGMIPGQSKNLPAAGEPTTPATINSQTSVSATRQAELMAKFGIPAESVTYYPRGKDVFADLDKLDKLGGNRRNVAITQSRPTKKSGPNFQPKPLVTYTHPDQVRRKDSAFEALRMLSPFNMLPIPREAYRKAVTKQPLEGVSSTD